MLTSSRVSDPEASQGGGSWRTESNGDQLHEKLWTNAWSQTRTRDDIQARSTEGTLVSELGWPSGAIKRVANGLGWPRGDHEPAVVSRETVPPEPEASARDDAPGVNGFPARPIEAEHVSSTVSPPDENPALDPINSQGTASSEPPQPEAPTHAPHGPGEAAPASEPYARPAHAGSREPVSLLQASTPAAPDPEADPELGSLADADPLPERQYATADAFGSREDTTSRAFSSGLPEVRMSTSNDSPPPETEAPAISVSVTRPWLEVDPIPGFRAQVRDEQMHSSAPAPPMPPATGSQPLVESISLMDDSTPLALEVAEDTRRRIELAGRQFPRPKDTRSSRCPTRRAASARQRARSTSPPLWLRPASESWCSTSTRRQRVHRARYRAPR